MLGLQVALETAEGAAQQDQLWFFATVSAKGIKEDSPYWQKAPGHPAKDVLRLEKPEYSHPSLCQM